MLNKPTARLLKEGTAKLREGQTRMLTLGPVCIAYHKSLFAPIVAEEQLHNLVGALGLSLASMYPTLELQDPESLLGAIEMAMIIGMLTGRKHADAIPPELASLVQPLMETQA